MKKRIITLIMMLVLCTMSVAACSGKSDELAQTTWKLSGGKEGDLEITADQLSSLLGDISIEFKKDGKMSMTASDETQDGTYEINGDTVTLHDDGEDDLELKLDGDKLIMEESGVSVEFTKQ